MPRLVVLGLVCTLFLVACVRNPGGIAPSNVPIGPNGYDELGPTAASDCKVNILGFLPVSGGNQVADAVAGALAKHPNADALVGITVDSVYKNFLLWTQHCTEVRATAVRRR